MTNNVWPFDPTTYKAPEEYRPDPQEQFADVLEGFGIELRGPVYATDKPVRCKIKGRKQKPGWYLFFDPDPVTGIAGGVYGDWHHDGSLYWSSKNDIDMTADELASYRAHQNALREKAKAARLEAQEVAATEALAVLESLPWATKNEYLKRKKVKAFGVYSEADALVIPIRNIAGDIRSLQRIYANGGKYMFPDGEVSGCFHLIGSAFTEPTYIAEGYATAATIHEVTGKSVVVSFFCHNTKPVVDAIRGAGNKHRLIIAADSDKKQQGEKAAIAACADQLGVSYVVPTFNGSEGSDFNDLSAEQGPAAVSAQLAGEGVDNPNELVLTEICDLGEPEEADWLIEDYLIGDSFGLLYGPSGSGKSFIAIDMLLCIATGTDWHGHKVKQGPVVYVCGEGKRGILKRAKAWAQHHSIEWKNIPFYISSQPIPFLDTASVNKFIEVTANLVTNIGDVEVVCIDTLNRNWGDGDENSTKDMTTFVAACSEVQRVIAALVFIVHHTGLSDKSRSRGNSALRAALDIEMELSETKALTCTKMKDEDTFKETNFTLQPVQLTEKINSCVPVLDENPTVAADSVANFTYKGKVQAKIEDMLKDYKATSLKNNPSQEFVTIDHITLNKAIKHGGILTNNMARTKKKLIEQNVIEQVNDQTYKVLI